MSGFSERRRAFFQFIWNSEEGTFLGRGGRSWAEIGFFYLIYYTCLAGFFVGMLAVFYQTVDEKRPKLTGSDSLLKGNPGMGFQPMTDVEYTLIRFESGPKTYTPIVDSIKKVLKPYIDRAAGGSENPGLNCSKTVRPGQNEYCAIDYKRLTAECNVENSFGYKPNQGEVEPCVLLRLNKIFDWQPENYTAETLKDSHASEGLQKKILADPEMIYVECVGENPADRDNMGDIMYYPEQGFRHYYYPFKNQPGYLSPVVFVKFLKPKNHVALMIECRALAPNIHYDKQEKEGGVHFELLADQ